MNEGFLKGGAGIEEVAKELAGCVDSKPSCSGQIDGLKGDAKLTSLALLGFELREWSFGICWTMGLPFPVHWTLM